MTKRQTSHRPGKQFDRNDIVRLLRGAVEREGGQTAFAKRHRIDRSSINRVLKGKLRAAFRATIRQRTRIRRCGLELSSEEFGRTGSTPKL
jgi:DNA-binding phage protein